MTITQLNYVLAVAEEKNFTQAAEKCFVTQPTLSMQIQKLEEELNIQLFDRTKKPIQPTPIGQKIIEQAQKIVSESSRISDIIEQQKGFIGGEFRIGIIPTVMPTLLPMFLQLFIKKYPKINLIIEELTTQELVERLKKGKLDCAIAATPLEVETIQERPLYYEPFVVYTPDNHILATKNEIDVNELDFSEVLLLQDGHCFRDGILNLCQTSIDKEKANFQLESGSFETLIKLVDEGLGITLLPYLHTLDLTHKKNCKEFKNPKPSREISLIYPKNELKKHIIEALYQTIQSVVRGAIAFQDVKIISPIKK